MNQGVEILLARMDSNPDEFVGTSWPKQHKWGWVMDDLRKRMAPTKEEKEFGLPLRFLSDDEVRMLWEKLESLRADQFTKAVMQTLLQEEEVDPFTDAVVRGMGQLAQYDIKPNKLILPAKLNAELLKMLEQEAPDLEEESRKQILRDLEALEARKTMKVKSKGRYKV